MRVFYMRPHSDPIFHGDSENRGPDVNGSVVVELETKTLLLDLEGGRGYSHSAERKSSRVLISAESADKSYECKHTLSLWKTTQRVLKTMLKNIATKSADSGGGGIPRPSEKKKPTPGAFFGFSNPLGFLTTSPHQSSTTSLPPSITPPNLGLRTSSAVPPANATPPDVFLTRRIGSLNFPDYPAPRRFPAK
ncbi:hypothetical protein FB451DRAFT_1180860 [Mycena latifolia]|nr:hypothetical protein FB451DRAFT_1180860 [Mycena latifolia]